MDSNAHLRKDPSPSTGGGVGFALGPLPAGLATALGGALRRVMLSCLPAPAITSARIVGAPHPFGSVTGVTPDVPAVLNRLARVCFVGDVSGVAELELEASGPALVRAGDLRCPAGLRIANPELVLAEVSAGGALSVAVTVEAGIGYPQRVREGPDGACAVCGIHRAVRRVRIEHSGADLLLHIEALSRDAECCLRDAALLLQAHLQFVLGTGPRDGSLAALSSATREHWRAGLGGITYSYDSTSRCVELRGVQPQLAGAAGELLSAALAAPAAGHPILASSAVTCPLMGDPVLRIRCEPGEGATDCLQAVRGAAAALCDLLAALAREPEPEPVALAPTPTVARQEITGRLELERPDLRFIPEDHLDIPRQSFSRLVGEGEGSLAELIETFFPLSPEDCAWRLEVSGVRTPAPVLTPQECLATGEGHCAPILLRLALLGPDGELRQEREASVGLLPWMTSEATFILPGRSAEVLVIGELAPAPGASAYRLQQRAFATLAPAYGPAITFRTSARRSCQVSIGSGRSMDIGLLLVALGATASDTPVPAGLEPERCREQVADWLAATGAVSQAKAQEAVAACLDAPGMECSAAAFRSAVGDSQAWGLGPRGRERLERRLGVRTGEGPALSWEDVAADGLLLEAVAEGSVPGDDPVALSTHILRTPGRQIADVVRQALASQVPAITQRLQAAGTQPPDIEDLMADLTIGAAISGFFGSSPLVAPVEDTNPLARLQSARRVVLSIGRQLGYDADDPLCRQWLRDAPGRLCMVETPEGPNVGLVGYLASGARVDDEGFLLAPLRPVRDGTVADEIVWLRPETELGVNVCDPLPAGTRLSDLGGAVTCRRDGLLGRCTPDQIAYCEAGHGSNVGLSAGLIPASAHSDTTRLLMGANMQRQAVRLIEPEWPLVTTGLDDGWPQPPVPGRNLLVAYVPWLGHNFEDAIVVSQEVVSGGVLSSVHRERVTITLRPELALTATPEGFPPARLRALGPDGLPRRGASVRPGDVLVGVAELGADRDLVRQVAGDAGFGRCLLVPQHVSGTVGAVLRQPARRGEGFRIEVEILSERPLSLGDKLSNRHGGKGVVGRVVPVEQMPFLPDGTPIEVLINPLGVPSRLNLGQLFETSLGWVANALRARVVLPPGVAVDRGRLSELLRRAGLSETGKVALRDGRTGRLFDQPALVGFLFIHKLDHMAQDKVHARSTGPYSTVTQQPAGGRARSGGQRFGEMETWALQAYGAAYTLRELLTIKSDDVRGRDEAFAALLAGETPGPVDAPESLSLLIEELRALGLTVELRQ